MTAIKMWTGRKWVDTVYTLKKVEAMDYIFVDKPTMKCNYRSRESTKAIKAYLENKKNKR